MAVTGVQRKYSKRAWRRAAARGLTEIWQVTYDAPPTTADDVRTATHGGNTVPLFREAHDDDANLKVVSVDVAMEGMNRTSYLVTVEYETDRADTPEDDPLDDPVQVSWSGREYTESIVEDIDGNPILNSALDPYDPAYVVDKQRLMVRIVRNESLPSYSPADADDYMGSINTDNVTIAGLTVTARQAKLNVYAADKQYRNGTWFWRVTYEVEFKASGWVAKLVDHGLYRWTGAVTNPASVKRPCIVNGKEAEVPQRLDGTGQQLTLSTPASGTIYGTWYVRKERAFGPLGLNV